MKGPVLSFPVGEIKPQGVYDIPPTQGVSELIKSWVRMSISVCIGRADVCSFIGIGREWHTPKGRHHFHEGGGEKRESGKEASERRQQFVKNL